MLLACETLGKTLSAPAGHSSVCPFLWDFLSCHQLSELCSGKVRIPTAGAVDHVVGAQGFSLALSVGGTWRTQASLQFPHLRMRRLWSFLQLSFPEPLGENDSWEHTIRHKRVRRPQVSTTVIITIRFSSELHHKLRHITILISLNS